MPDIDNASYFANIPHGLSSPALRGIVAGTLGAPVDLISSVANLMRAGYGAGGHALGLLKAEDMPEELPEQRGGSEWFGRKGEELGLWDATRNPVVEMGSGILAGHAAPAIPATISRTAELLRQAPQAARNATAAAMIGTSRAAPMGEIAMRQSRPAVAARVREPKALTPEQREENLRQWFGSSKVTDAEGNPRVLYHATPNEFDEFKAGGDDPTKSGRAIWLGTDAAKPQAAHNVGGGSRGFKEGTRTVPAYVKMERPLVIDDEASREWARSVWGDNFPQLMGKDTLADVSRDYDGVLYHDPATGKLSEVVAFKPEQLKSAIGNSGLYDPTSASLTDPLPARVARAMRGSGRLASPPRVRKGQPVGDEPLDVRTIEDARAAPQTEAPEAPEAPYIQTSSTSGELPLFDLRPEALHPTDVAQEDLYRMRGRGGKYPERMQALLDSPIGRRVTDQLIARGREIDPMLEHWYGTAPLREAFAQENAGLEDWPRFMAHMASASQRNPVDQQNKMGSLMWMMDRNSLFNPDVRLLTNAMREEGDTAGPLIELPPGYGSLAQGDIFKRSKQLALGEDPMAVLPEDKKLGTFVRNLMGNYRPVTVDVNAVKGPAIMSRDPRWLETKVVDKDPSGKVIATHTPRSDVLEGRMSMKEATDRPGFWIAAPEGSEYGGFEDLWQRAAKRAGVSPAAGQALGWYGSADVGALKTKPELYLQNLERLIRTRAGERGRRPTEILADMLRGDEHL